MKTYTRDELKPHILSVFFWQKGVTCFTSSLFDLFVKADASNKLKLLNAFNIELTALKMWQESADEAEFFKDWNQKKGD